MPVRITVWLCAFLWLVALTAGTARAQTRAQFDALGGYQAYLAEPGNASLRNPGGICDEEAAFAHWRDFGFAEGRGFATGGLRSDLPGGGTDPDYAIDGGFSWAYPGANTVVFITQDAAKPAGWAGRAMLLDRCQEFNLGTGYTAAAYRTVNSDVAAAIDSGSFPSFFSVTDHYVKYGFKEGRLTATDWTQAQLDSWVDSGYFAANPLVETFFLGAQSEGWLAFGKIGFAHWINFGRFEGRDPGQPSGAVQAAALMTRFDEAAYLSRNPGVAALVPGTFASGRDHFDQFGKADFAAGNLDRRPNDYFDNAFYLAQNPQVQPLLDSGQYATAWDHWVAVGAQAGLVALPVALGFDAAYYLAQYPSLQSQIGVGLAYPTALIHYLDQGQTEGKNPYALFDETYYVAFYGLASAISAGTVTSGHDHYQRFGKALGNRTIRAIAGVLTVGTASVNDYATIQAAINQANDGETVRIPAGTYPNGAFGVFDKSLRIEGAGKGLTILHPDVKIDPSVIANTGGGVAVLIASTTPLPQVTITGITFENGDNRLEAADYLEGVAGGLTVRRVVLTLSDCEFIANKSMTGGAMILEDSDGSTVTDCTFRNNVAQRDGGAIAVAMGGLASLTNSRFEDNTMETRPYNYVHDGAGIHNSPGFSAVGVPYSAGDAAADGEFYDRTDTGAFRLSFATVVGPAYEGFYGGPLGGAIALNASSPTIQGNTFLRNKAPFAGGAIYMIDGSAPTIDSGNLFQDNQSSRGGALYSESGRVTAVIAGNTFTGNSAPADLSCPLPTTSTCYPGSGKGGAIALYFNSSPRIGGPLVADRNVFQNNLADYGGGAIAVYEHLDPLAEATIENNLFEDNRVTALDRGGLIPASDGVSSLDRFGIAAGGAIEVADAKAVIRDNDFRRNVARLGAGVAIEGQGDITGNLFQDNTVIPLAVGTFPGDVDVVGSGLWLMNPLASPPLRATVSTNTFLTGNTPHDIVQTGPDLGAAFQITQPGADLFTCIPGVACP